MHTFLIFSAIYLLAIMSPGPDFFLITRNTLLYSRQHAVITACGVATGATVHLSYCIFGLNLIADNANWLIQGVKYLGGSYLIYLGIKGLLTRKLHYQELGHIENTHISYQKAYYQGLLCNLLNPKAALFFISTFTLLAQSKTPLFIQLGYALEVILLTLLWFSILSIIFTIPKIKHKLKKIQAPLIKVLSVLLIFFGIYLINLPI